MLAQQPIRPELPDNYHHPLSASSAKRWMNCALSVKANAGVGKSNNAAKFGTLVHEAAAALYSDGFVEDMPLEVIAVAQQFLALLKPLIDGADLIRIEERVYLDSIVVNLFDTLSGTPDAAACSYFGKLLVVDLKTGYIDVPVNDNYQLLSYALGCYSALDEFAKTTITSVELIIIQINDSKGAQVKKQTITVDELLEFEKKVQAAVINVEENPDSAVAGDWCGYCAIAMTCKANKQHLLEATGTNLVAYDPAVQLPMPQDIARFLKVIPALRKQIDQLEDKALKMELDNPGTIPGYKAVTTFGHRKWIDKAKVLEMAMDYRLDCSLIMEKPDLKSPAQVEKVYKELVNSETVHKPSNGYRLVERKDESDEIDKFLEGK